MYRRTLALLVGQPEDMFSRNAAHERLRKFNASKNKTPASLISSFRHFLHLYRLQNTNTFEIFWYAVGFITQQIPANIWGIQFYNRPA